MNLDAIGFGANGLVLDVGFYPPILFCTLEATPYAFAVLIDRDAVGTGQRSVRRGRRFETVIEVLDGKPVRQVDDPAPPQLSDVLIIDAVDIEASPADGTWYVDAAGGVYSTGVASFHGSLGGLSLDEPIVALVTHPSGRGYWLIGRDGGVFAFGAALFHGSIPGVLPVGVSLNAPIVGATATTTGNGYWLVSADGGVFAFGDARFLGSVAVVSLTAGVPRNPIVGMAASAFGEGYVLVSDTGALFLFGDARGDGLALTRAVDYVASDHPSADDVTGIALATGGDGLWIERGIHIARVEGSAVNGGDEHPARRRFLQCPIATQRHAKRFSSRLADLTPPGLTRTATMMDQVRSWPAFANGLWLRTENVMTDVLGHRQIWLAYAREDSTGSEGWHISGLVECNATG